MPTQLTFGQVRSALKSANAAWTVGPAKLDTDPVPEHALGGKIDGLIEAARAPKLDLASVITVPTENPVLIERRAALKLGPAPVQLRSLPAFAAAPAASPQGAAPAAPPPAGGSGRAASVDWRNRGWPWLCTVQDQIGENCWAMAATALVETMVRISHAVWSKRSEGDVHDGMNAPCSQGGSATAALDWIKQNGITDLDNYTTQCNLPYHTAPDRSGRTVKIGDYTLIGDIEQQKVWLDTVGPIITWFDVWHDFDYHYDTTDDVVYRWSATLPGGAANYERGGHFMLVVGYDDVSQSWICRNSWGSSFGHGGYIRVGYGDANSGIERYARIGLQITNPDPWTKRRLHNGGMIESGDGALHRNFELVARGAGNSVIHWWRDGGDLSWHQAETLGNDAGGQPVFTGTTFNRNFEFIVQTTNSRLHHWFFDQSSNKWLSGPVFGPADTAGQPGFLQSSFGQPGNFEVVVRVANGQLAHWWRTNASPYTWAESARFGANIAYSGPTLVQSHYKAPGNLELVAVRTDGCMQHFWRDDIGGTGWHAGVTFGAGIASPPVMIEGQYGATDENAVGNFELCVAHGGQVEHWWRNNQVPGTAGGAWTRSAVFGQDVSSVVALIEGSYGFNLEMIVARTDARLQHYWRDGAGWHAGVIIGPTVLPTIAHPPLVSDRFIPERLTPVT